MFNRKLLNLLTYFPAMLLAILLTITAAAQQADDSNADVPEATATDDTGVDDATTDDADETAEAAEDIEDADLDEQTYEQDDDDFVPTEEIPADEPIPFPSNI